MTHHDNTFMKANVCFSPTLCEGISCRQYNPHVIQPPHVYTLAQFAFADADWVHE